ncbi:MAG: carbohydrate binding family 9 domain-containing protein [Flavobacteriaceae bacterium]|nr:carbohydrate binding family 9 domain-containing protein [Flavobacteriaceae bacterium]
MGIIRTVVLSLCLLTSSIGVAQTTSKGITARYIEEQLNLDGNLNEAVWETAETGSDFIQFFPTDSLAAKFPTTFKILYSETTLYIGVRAEAENGNYVVSSLRRDFGGTTNDNISLLFDTFNDATTAYFFGVTPYGVQREGLVSEGGSNFNNTWDIKWQAEAQRFEDHYTVEIAIPFTSLKFIEGATSWRFRSYRWNIQSNEQTSWTQIPQNQLLSSLAYMGELKFEKPLGRSRTPLALIPYLNTLVDRDNVTDETKTNLKVGGDAKIAIGDAMNLDITVNPDFSNVEVDDIFTNLTRFEIQLPEKRQFFIDNSDLFANYGNPLDNIPFFSRRIGLARDPEGNLVENQIIGGVRLSGKLNPTLRMGFLNLQTEANADNEIGSFNNMMLSFQKKVFSRSNLGVFWINRQTFGNEEYLDPDDRYNRVIGLDYDLASADNIWTGNFFLHKSFQPDDSQGNISSQARLNYDDRNWRFVADFVYVDEEYRADLGFVPRKDIFKTGNSITRRFYPKNAALSNHSIKLLGVNFWRPNLDFRHTDYFYQATWDAAFTSQATLSARYQHDYIFLVDDFDPTRMEGAVPLPGNRGYSFNQFSVEFNSNPSKLLTVGARTAAGGFFNGRRYAFGGELGYRFQPWANVSFGVNYDGIRLPEPYSNADIWLATTRAEITFSKSLFWNTLVQYSNQRDNFGINSRLQWRFAPLSDLFLVYNDNYFTENFAPRFRSLNLKLTYWLNI